MRTYENALRHALAVARLLVSGIWLLVGACYVSMLGIRPDLLVGSRPLVAAFLCLISVLALAAVTCPPLLLKGTFFVLFNLFALVVVLFQLEWHTPGATTLWSSTTAALFWALLCALTLVMFFRRGGLALPPSRAYIGASIRARSDDSDDLGD